MTSVLTISVGSNKLIYPLLSLLLCFFALPCPQSYATNTSPSENLFEKGLAAYQNKQYAEAQSDFQKVLDENSNNPSVLHNLALSAYQNDQRPLALALWRKALSIRPDFRAARVWGDYIERKTQMRPLERDSLNLWMHHALEQVPLFSLLWLDAILLAIVGTLWLRYFGKRRAALEEEMPLPAFPSASLLSLALFAVVVSASVMRAKYELTARATITAKKTSARSLPTDEGVGLFDISGGNEVLVRRQQDGWTQVQNADGASGWIKDRDLLITSGTSGLSGI